MTTVRMRCALLGLALLIPVAASAQSISVGPGQLCGNSRQAIQANLLGYAEGYASARGYRLGQGAEFDFSRAMERAAADLNNLPSAVCQRRLFEAHLNTRRYVDAMIDASRTIPGYSNQSPGVIGEQTFASAKRLCPIWPFCF